MPAQDRSARFYLMRHAGLMLLVLAGCALMLYLLAACASPTGPAPPPAIPDNPCTGTADAAVAELGPGYTLTLGTDTETLSWYNATAHEQIATLVLTWGPNINGCFSEWN